MAESTLSQHGRAPDASRQGHRRPKNAGKGRRQHRWRKIGGLAGRPPFYWLSPHLPRSCLCCSLRQGVCAAGAFYAISALVSLAILIFDMLFEWRRDEPWLIAARVTVIVFCACALLLVGAFTYLGASTLREDLLTASLYGDFFLVFLGGVSTILLFSSIFTRTHEVRRALLVAEGGFRTAFLVPLPIATSVFAYTLLWRLRYRPHSLLSNYRHLTATEQSRTETLSIITNSMAQDERGRSALRPRSRSF